MHDLRSLWLERDNWTFWYAFYRCKEDPRFVVPKPNRDGRPKWWLGMTWNVAHPSTFLVMAMFVGVFLGVPALAMFLGATKPVMWIVVISTFLIEWRIAWVMGRESRGDAPARS